MNDNTQWLRDIDSAQSDLKVDGLVEVQGYLPDGKPLHEVSIMEKAIAYGAYAVFFEVGRNGAPAKAQAFVFVSDNSDDDQKFAELHKRLWSWGGVPLVYRKKLGLIQLFRCAHNPDFIVNNVVKYKPFKTLTLATAINDDPLWDAVQLRNGAIWDNPIVCKSMLSDDKSAHKHLIEEVKKLYKRLGESNNLNESLRRKLIILSLLIAYLEERGVLLPDYFATFQSGATKFFEVMANGEALVNLLKNMEERFNGNVFYLDDRESQTLRESSQLKDFARLIEGNEENNGQLALWKLYSFKDLPVEIISHIYQLFVTDPQSSIYTPPFLVRLMLDEAMSSSLMDRLNQRNEIILDPACGSGIFLVEAYKRLVLHWRSHNGWARPSVDELQRLLMKIHGIDLEEGAVELAAFSLCLALCDALEPEAIRASIKLFPVLAGKTLHHSCFFEAKEKGLVKEPIGLVTGNPPFKSQLTTEGAKKSFLNYKSSQGALPDKQLAYLFLHESMEMLADGGVLVMLQHYGFLYNQKPLNFRRNFISKWNVRELLDFVSVRGLFQKGGADTKVVVILAEATKPSLSSVILHATFRRSGRVDAELGFDIDYYDLHWLPCELVLENDSVWRANLLGGGRVLDFVDRLKAERSLEKYAESQKWVFGEGFIFGNINRGRQASHVIGKAYISATDLNEMSILRDTMSVVQDHPIEWPGREAIYSPPQLLIRKHKDLAHGFNPDRYLTYNHDVFGISAAGSGGSELEAVSTWLTRELNTLQAFTACTSSSLSVSKATVILSSDIKSLPYPESGRLDVSANEKIIVDDVLKYNLDLVRLGEGSSAMSQDGIGALPDYCRVFTGQINAIYKNNPLQVLPPQRWPGAICQAFSFGTNEVDWNGVDGLKEKINSLLHEQQGTGLHITRIARIYDENFIFLLKPSRLRYWLRSVALRDADETMSDLHSQGF